MATTPNQIVREHVVASKRFRESVRGDAAKARAFLIKAGILHKGGKKLTKRYR
jgi:hypothetical protein